MEAICAWPDGQIREVMVLAVENGMAKIIWNEHVDSDYKAVTGFEEIVPVSWLEYK